MVERTQKLAYELEDARRTNRSLQTVSVVSLGFGLGTGGVLGAIFVLVVGYVSQRSART
jgi:ABC-type transport system involved in cytochrome c biogenesis permease subunit